MRSGVGRRGCSHGGVLSRQAWSKIPERSQNMITGDSEAVARNSGSRMRITVINVCAWGEVDGNSVRCYLVGIAFCLALVVVGVVTKQKTSDRAHISYYQVPNCCTSSTIPHTRQKIRLKFVWLVCRLRGVPHNSTAVLLQHRCARHDRRLCCCLYF